MFADLVEELMGFDDAAITERFRELELRRRRDEAELAALVAVAEARAVYTADGHLTVQGWLRANANWSPAEVNAARRKARLVNDHPSVGDALLDGHIGVAQVAELARLRANPRCGDELGEVIDQLVDYGEQLDYPTFCKVAKRWENLADADGAHHDSELSNEHRTASIHAVDDGVDLRASGGDAVSTGWLMKIFDEFVEAEFHADVAAGKASLFTFHELVDVIEHAEGERFSHIVLKDIKGKTTRELKADVVLPMLGAIVTDRGGQLCHAAIVSREGWWGRGMRPDRTETPSRRTALLASAYASPASRAGRRPAGPG